MLGGGEPVIVDRQAGRPRVNMGHMHEGRMQTAACQVNPKLGSMQPAALQGHPHCPLYRRPVRKAPRHRQRQRQTDSSRLMPGRQQGGQADRWNRQQVWRLTQTAGSAAHPMMVLPATGPLGTSWCPGRRPGSPGHTAARPGGIWDCSPLGFRV